MTGMGIGTSKPEAIILNHKRVVCLLPVGGELLSQVKRFVYLEILLTSEGGMECDINRKMGGLAAVMHSHCSEEEAEPKSKASNLLVSLCTYLHTGPLPKR